MGALARVEQVSVDLTDVQLTTGHRPEAWRAPSLVIEDGLNRAQPSFHLSFANPPGTSFFVTVEGKRGDEVLVFTPGPRREYLPGKFGHDWTIDLGSRGFVHLSPRECENCGLNLNEPLPRPLASWGNPQVVRSIVDQNGKSIKVENHEAPPLTLVA